MIKNSINPLNAKLNPICHLLALLGAHHILHVSRIRVNPVFLHDIVNFAKCACSDILGKKLITIISYTTE
jgi:hypothetical protein